MPRHITRHVTNDTARADQTNKARVQKQAKQARKFRTVNISPRYNSAHFKLRSEDRFENKVYFCIFFSGWGSVKSRKLFPQECYSLETCRRRSVAEELWCCNEGRRFYHGRGGCFLKETKSENASVSILRRPLKITRRSTLIHSPPIGCPS